MKHVTFPIIAVLCSLPFAHAAVTHTWAGGVDFAWTTDNDGDTNWNTDALPASGDTVNISDGSTVISPTNSLEPNLTINLTGGSKLDRTGSVVRMNGATVYVGSASGLTGNGFWDVGDASFTFETGAVVTTGDWELKGVNSHTFILGATGFDASSMTPGAFRNDGNNPASPATLISNDTFIADLANYTGGVGVITLMDFASDGEANIAYPDGMTNAAFQNANLVIDNPGSYTANLQWNDIEHSIELSITAIPEPSSVMLLGLGGLTLVLRRRK